MPIMQSCMTSSPQDAVASFSDKGRAVAQPDTFNVTHAMQFLRNE
jgi:hypothetical protein